ncbi:hypothetical protein F5Y13DRAFT_199974 [Hypoxylon sp. FL1857]|nr:hypothetical protein F5Y13DRAFT_199974 [Hypoxylon sp. FL1857]
MDILEVGESSSTLFAGTRNAAITLLAVTACCVIARFVDSFTRGGKRLNVDDILSLLALILLACYSALNYVLANDLQHPDYSKLTSGYFAQQSTILTFVAGFAMYFSKAPILVLYVRLFGIKTWLRVVSYSTLALSFVVFLTTMSIAGATCSQSAEVDPNFLDTCLKTTVAVGVANGATAVVTDIIIIILPLPIIAGLTLPFHKKIGLAVVFSTGIFAIAASAISLYFKSISLAGHSTAFAVTLVCTIFECCLAIMVGCAPALRACWAKIERNNALYAKARSRLAHFRSFRSTENGKPEDQDYTQLP